MNILKKYVKGGTPKDNPENLKPGQTGTYGPVGDADPDQLTFKEAFAAFRRAGVEKFKWRGKWYTTETKDEKKSEYDTPANRKKMDEMKKEWKDSYSFDAKGKPKVIRKFVKGGTTNEESNQVSPILKPSERIQRRPTMTDRKLAKIEEREQKKALRNREIEKERMSRMSDRGAIKHARQQARGERKMERQQMRQGRKEQRQFRRTMRRKGREERREARGMTYTGGRRISPRRWTKNLLDKLGRRYVGEGRLKGYRDFRTSNISPAYYKTEAGDPLSRRSRSGRIRSGRGTFRPERGSVTRYKAGGMVTDAPIMDWDMDKGEYTQVGKRGMVVRKYNKGGTSYYKDKIYDSYEEAKKAMDTKITDWGDDEKSRIFPYYGPVITEGEHKGKRRIQKSSSVVNPKYSTFDKDVRESIKKSEIDAKNKQTLKEQGYTEGEDFKKGGVIRKYIKGGINAKIINTKEEIDKIKKDYDEQMKKQFPPDTRTDEEKERDFRERERDMIKQNMKKKKKIFKKKKNR